MIGALILDRLRRGGRGIGAVALLFCPVWLAILLERRARR